MAINERRLVILRHAKSAWPDDSVAERQRDLERPLAERGQRDAPVAGQWLREHLGRVDLARYSPARRARETWEYVAAELDPVPAVQEEPRLYGGSTDQLLAAIRELPEQARLVVFVGHNPDLEELLAMLTGASRQLKTSTLAVLKVADGWAGLEAGRAELESLTAARG